MIYKIVYILALPIWNFILPIYSFWHFDDFSWGETRKVNGDTRKGKNSKILEDEENQKFWLEKNNRTVLRKLWHIWEKEKLSLPSPEKLKRVIQAELDVISEPHLQPSLQSKKNQSPQSPPQQIHNYDKYHANHLPKQQYARAANVITDYSQQPKSILSRRDRSASSMLFYQQQQRHQFIERQRHFIHQDYNRYYNQNNFY